MPVKPKPKPRRTFLPLPPDFCPVDATVDEVASFRREGRWMVFKKIREGRYESYLEGRIRKIIFASVLEDRERAIAASNAPPDTGKRRVGRPPKDAAQQQTGRAP
jgi:hypothetical protein